MIRVVAVLLTILFAADAYAEWKRYENDYFVVYSQGKAKRVERLVRELELFRAASLQVFSIRAPADAPKTLVVLAKNLKEYRDYGGSRRLVGFARREGRQTLIVMSSGGNSNNNMNIIRHEYAHALLGYDDFNYPSWYEEGFAELAAYIEIDADASMFSLGLGTDRRLGSGEVAVPWNELIDDQFSAHSFFDSRDASAAYGQSWLLMHYLSLGPDAENATKLAYYIADLKKGTPSKEAFKTAFGVMPQDIWDKDMHDYPSRLPYYQLRFTGLESASEFHVTAPTEDELAPILEHLTMPQKASAAKRLKTVEIDDFLGHWAPLRFSKSCSDPIEVQHRAEENRFAIHWKDKRNAEGLPNFVEYSLEPEKRGGFHLTQVSETGKDHNIVPEVIMTYREGDMLCFAHPEDKHYACDQYFLRCPAQ